ncbi:hypothetical protein HDU96_005396 [Phlyctochytrium bullatum]|nr:hypothetical protein HDU96_005396 [Phlyctochytrium bullatum]
MWAPNGLPSYLTAIPTIPGAGSWAPAKAFIPNVVESAEKKDHNETSPYSGFAALSLKHTGEASRGPATQDLSRFEEKRPEKAGPPLLKDPITPSRLELDFTSLLDDLNQTHQQLLSAQALSRGENDHIIGTYQAQGGADDDEDSERGGGGIRSVGANAGESNFNPSQRGRDSRSTSGSSRSSHDREEDAGSVSEDSDDESYDGRPLALRHVAYSPKHTKPLPRREDNDDSEAFRYRNPAMENINLEESQEEIEMIDDGDESDDVQLALKYPNPNLGYSQGQGARGAMQAITMDDYKDDMDGLQVMLDKYMKKSRYSKMINGESREAQPHSHPAPHPLPPRTTSHSKPVSPPQATESEPMDDLPLAQLQTLRRKPKTPVVPQPEPESPAPPKEPVVANEKDNINAIVSKLSEANLKKITTRVYIESADSFETIVVTSLMTADQVIAELTRRPKIEQSPDWTLFELANDLGIGMFFFSPCLFDRLLTKYLSLRQTQNDQLETGRFVVLEFAILLLKVVTDVIASWDATATLNAILMKKYGYRSTIVPKSIVGRFPKIQGYLYLEMRPRKWQKKFCVLREGSVYYYKESNMTSETMLCRLSGFDVYTLSRDKKRTPTQFCFALRSTSNIALFENKVDYVRFLCVDRQDRLYDWVLAIRLAKNELTFQEFPELFDDYDVVPARDRLGVQVPKEKKEPGGTLLDFDGPISPSRHLNGQSGKESGGAGVISPPSSTPQGFVASSNTLLGNRVAKEKSSAAVKTEDKVEHVSFCFDISNSLQVTSQPTMPQKPLLSFDTITNYQERGGSSPHIDASPKRSGTKKSSVAKAVSSPSHRSRSRAREPDSRALDAERERTQMMDDLWEQEQAEMERLIAEERRRLAQNDGEASGSADARRREAPRSGRERSRHREEGRAKQEPARKPTWKKSAGDKEIEKERGAHETRTPTLGRSRNKPLVDVSSANNCMTCGCSEFRSAHGFRAEMCTNWYIIGRRQ